LTSGSAPCLISSSALLLFDVDLPGDPYFITTWRCPRAKKYRASTGCVVRTMGKDISLNLLRKLWCWEYVEPRKREREKEREREREWERERD